MSKGNKVVPVRLTPELLTEMDALIQTTNARRRGAPYCRSSFLVSAVKEKIDHMRRARKRARTPADDVVRYEPTVCTPNERTVVYDISDDADCKEECE